MTFIFASFDAYNTKGVNVRITISLEVNKVTNEARKNIIKKNRYALPLDLDNNKSEKKCNAPVVSKERQR